MNCPYCGIKIKRGRKTCNEQSCIEEEVRSFSLEYPTDFNYCGTAQTADNAFRDNSYGKIRERHDVV